MASGFQTTQWSLIAKIRSGNSQQSAMALDELCRNYWSPLYVWLRMSGISKAESEDLTQGFFAHVIRNDVFAKVDAQKGKLRSFLLICLKRFLAKEQARKNALKRGGAMQEFSLDFIDSDLAESMVAKELTSQDAIPSEVYEYRWARTLLDMALTRLKNEYESNGKAEIFHAMKPMLSEMDAGKTYADTAARLKCSEGAARVAFHRFKQRFRVFVHEEVAKTIVEGETVEEELSYLVRVLDRTNRQ